MYIEVIQVLKTQIAKGMDSYHQSEERMTAKLVDAELRNAPPLDKENIK
jgi:hypothetical protein